jgi:hypothetical protein
MSRSTSHFLIQLAVALPLATLGCSSSDDDASSGRGTGGAGGTGGQLGEYPPEPYGRNVGETFPNLAWQGYVNDTAVGLASTQPFVDYTMDDVRKSGKGYAIVHVSEFF